MNSEIIENVKKNLINGLKLIDHIGLKHRFEVWRMIKGYDNYSVSSFGRVHNVKTGKVLKQNNRKGYKEVSLRINDLIKTYKIHRIVCQAFLDKIDGKDLVDHIDNV